MRPVAEFIMQGRKEAIMVAVIGATLPMFSWVSAAACALVWMRFGMAQAWPVTAAALVPSLVWAVSGNPVVFMVLLAAVLLAQVLRTTVSWPKVLLGSVLTTMAAVVLLGFFFQQPMAQFLAQVQQEAVTSMSMQGEETGLSEQDREQIISEVMQMIPGLFAAAIQLLSLLALMLGRYWQALLFNPGGFGREFRELWLPVPVLALLLAGVFVLPVLDPRMLIVTPVCMLPLVLVGLAILHGLAAAGKLTTFWLVVVYVGLVVFVYIMGPLLLILAVADTVFDFRGLRSKQPPRSS